MFLVVGPAVLKLKVSDYYFCNEDFKQIATAGTDTATGCKFFRKCDTAHIRRFHPAAFSSPASVSFGHIVGKTEGSWQLQLLDVRKSQTCGNASEIVPRISAHDHKLIQRGEERGKDLWPNLN